MPRVIHPDEELVRICSKNVSHYDRYHKLALPVSLLDYVWSDGVPNKGVTEFTFIDINGERWSFVCMLRRTAKGGYPQPEVSGKGWKDFINRKQIRVGDELAFYLPPLQPSYHHEPPPVFVISVKREIRLFNACFSGHIPL